MDFNSTAEEKEFYDIVKTFFLKKIKPIYPDWKSNNTTPPEMFKLLGEAKLLGFRKYNDGIIPIPWLQNIHYYKLAAEFSGGVAISSFASSQLGLQALYYFGSEEQKKQYLIPGFEGKAIFAFANTEPGAGSDAAAIAMRAELSGDQYTLNGTKAYITNGDIADHIILTAVSEPELEKRHKRISMFLVDGTTEGLSRFRLKKQAWTPSHLATLNFKDVSIPKERLLGELGHGFYQTMDIFNSSRIGISALTFGTALGAYKQAFKHANNRKTFGKTLFEHESKKNEFADIMSHLEAAWLLIQKAAYQKDHGLEFKFNASMAKLFTTEEALRITHWATELLGARGILTSHPVAAYPQDAKASMVGEGAPEVQKKIIAENIEERLNAF